MNIMKFLGFDTEDDDYEENDDYQEEKRPRKSAAKREGQAKSSNPHAQGKLIIYNGIATSDSEKRRLRDAINDGAMILIDLHTLDQREFEENGKDFITFMGGVAFARNGDIKFIEPAQYLVTPALGMYEIWGEGSGDE